jgi:hypothetical protein
MAEDQKKMKKEILIHNLIPYSNYPFITMDEETARSILSKFEIDHSWIKFIISDRLQSSMWVTTNIPDTIFINPKFPVDAACVLHEYAHLCANKKVQQSLLKEVKSPNLESLFQINAEYQAFKLTLSYLIKYKQFEMLRIHMLHLLYSGHSRKLMTDIPGPHEIAAKRLFKQRLFKKYRNLIDPLEILNRKYYKPSIMITDDIIRA